MGKVIVIGGGAAGLMAAGTAARAGAEVLVLEKMARCGRKLSITGKGRCNLTNMAELPAFLEHFSRTGPFLRQALSGFFNRDLMHFFEGIGLETVTERGGRLFPASGRAPDVTAALLKWAEDGGVRIVTSKRVERLLVSEGRVQGVMVKGKKVLSKAVVLATGGASYPLTGSTGDGYDLAQSVGHRIVPIRPALVPLETAGKAAAKMAGLALRNVGIRLLVNEKKRGEGFGEMAFTEFGVTGPVILTLSGMAVDALNAGKEVAFSIDLKPALDASKLDRRLQRDQAGRGREPVAVMLRGLLPREMVPVCTAETQIPERLMTASLTASQRKALGVWIKDFRLKVKAARPMAEAIITAGGVDTRQVDPKTMESRLVQGFFLAGEVLDIQADTGGFNLQAAFSTGRLAGVWAAKTPSGA